MRILCLVAAGAALWPVIPGSNAALYVTALSPFVAVNSLLVTRVLSVAAGLGLAICVAALVRHRFFCRWLCPMGVCADAATHVGRRLKRPSLRGPHMGKWIVLLTFGGALLGYPFLLWLDPLAIFTGLFNVIGSHWEPAAWVGVLGFIGIIGLSLARPGAWCGCVCPLGAFQDLLIQTRRSFGALVRRKVESDPPQIGGPRFVRRTLLGVAAGAVLSKVARSFHKSARPLRPPGARDESQFVGLCTRCGNCIRVCPSGIIRQNLGYHGLAGLLTPVLRLEHDYCRQDCARCTQVCPSGALARLPLERKPQVRIGLPEVDMSLCLLGEDRDCSACARWCPYGAIRYVFSEQDYTLTPQIDPNKCNGCGACQVACPTKPGKAIVIRPV